MRPNPSYPANVREFARRLWDAGYSTHRIRKSLQVRGYSPSHCTIRCWVDDEYREERLRRQRRFQRKGNGVSTYKRGWQQRLQRIRELREIGLSAEDTARVMALDYSLALSRHQIEALLGGKYTRPTTVRRLLTPESA